ncbi:MAG: hypothetical protein ACYC96_13750 [Fimbriimonadaceae bacterium]
MSPWIPVVALAVVVLGVGYMSTRPKESDSEQIVAALNDSIQASKDGRPGGVLDKLADGFKLNDQTVSTGQIADFIKKRRPSIDVLQPLPVVEDDVAHIVSPVRVSVHILGDDHGITVPDVDIQFHRETARAWLIFPVRTWHMTKIDVPPNALENLGPLAGLTDL